MSTHETVTDEELLTMKDLFKAATLGPWKRDVAYIMGQVPEGQPGGEVIAECCVTLHSLDRVSHIANARFMVAAHNETLRYIAEIEWLRTEVGRLQSMI